jgi:hypothetical protein
MDCHRVHLRGQGNNEETIHKPGESGIGALPIVALWLERRAGYYRYLQVGSMVARLGLRCAVRAAIEKGWIMDFQFACSEATAIWTVLAVGLFGVATVVSVAWSRAAQRKG